MMPDEVGVDREDTASDCNTLLNGVLEKTMAPNSGNEVGAAPLTEELPDGTAELYTGPVTTPVAAATV